MSAFLVPLYVDIPSCPFCLVESFEHVQNLERIRTENGIRWMYVIFPFCLLLVRFLFCTCLAVVRWCLMDPICDCASNGHVTNKTRVFWTYTACCPFSIGPTWWHRYLQTLYKGVLSLSLSFSLSLSHYFLEFLWEHMACSTRARLQYQATLLQAEVDLLGAILQIVTYDQNRGRWHRQLRWWKKAWLSSERRCSLFYLTSLWWDLGEKTTGHLWTSCGCLRKCWTC